MRSAQPRLLRSSAASSFLMRQGPRVSSGQGNADVAGLGEEAHRLASPLAAEPGLARAAERRAQVAHQPGVDPDDAGAQFRAEAVGAREVAGPDRGREAVVAGVGERQRLVVVVERLQRGYRPEDLL